MIPLATVVFAGNSKKNNPWAKVKQPKRGAPQAIGGYSAGCVIGGMELPVRGVGYQVARPARQRHFGHPLLIATVKDLAAHVKSSGHGVLFVGDLGQPRGGPAPSGHSSHQTGLDADIWFWHPKAAERAPMSASRTAKLDAPSMVSVKAKRKTKYWSAKVPAVLEKAASDSRVARIFINPVIKNELCKAATPADTPWMRKLRPWWGHNAHFHVRLECPSGSPDCKKQDPIPAGNGCKEIAWWLDEKAQAERKKKRKKYRKSVRGLPTLPAACGPVLK